MKIALIMLVFISIMPYSFGFDYPTQLPDCLKYIHVVEQGQVLPDDPPWTLLGKDDKVWIAEWRATYPRPTAQHCIDIQATASAWVIETRKTTDADFDGWSNAQLRALCKVLLSEINILRVKVGLAKRTATQLKAALKDEL